MSKAVLYYVYDPMCSWCWGYRDSWLKLSQALGSKDLSIEYKLGGLAPDSDVVMPNEMQQMLQGIWHKIHSQLGTQFNFDFWTQCAPQRSTYPACRACLIARDNDQEQAMLFSIQQAYYLQAKNPSLTSTLAELAESIGFNREWFEQQLNDDEVNVRFHQEISASRQLPIQGFPSLVLAVNGQHIPIAIDYLNWQKTYQQVIDLLN